MIEKIEPRRPWRVKLSLEDLVMVREDKLIPLRVPPGVQVDLFTPVEFEVPGRGVLIGTVMGVDWQVVGGAVAKVKLEEAQTEN